MPHQPYTFHIHGMHCESCVLLTESELSEHPRISSVTTSLTTRSVEIFGDFENLPHKDIAKELSGLLKKHGYVISTEPEKKSVLWNEFFIAIPIALLFGLFFIMLQKLGIVNLVNTNQVTYGTAFVIGIIASLSTCMAVVGGLVLSMSATFALEGDKVRPQVLFHLGRIAAFFILGGVIGVLGSVFQIGALGTFLIGVSVGLVMLILGVNLLDIFHWTKKLQPAMPKFLTKKTSSLTTLNHSLTPVLIGIATFFLPCGFTQSMQIYTLSTGSFLQGGLTMFTFALGTLPVLALLSFSSWSMTGSTYAGVFYKTAGLIVILFGAYNVINSLVGYGLLSPVFNF